MAQRASLPRVSQGWSQGVGGLGSCRDSLGKNHLQARLWQNSVPQGCRTEALFPCWLSARASLSTTQGTPTSSHMAPPTSAVTCQPSPAPTVNLLAFLFCYQWRNSQISLGPHVILHLR